MQSLGESIIRGAIGGGGYVRGIGQVGEGEDTSTIDTRLTGTPSGSEFSEIENQPITYMDRGELLGGSSASGLSQAPSVGTEEADRIYNEWTEQIQADRDAGAGVGVLNTLATLAGVPKAAMLFLNGLISSPLLRVAQDRGGVVGKMAGAVVSALSLAGRGQRLALKNPLKTGAVLGGLAGLSSALSKYLYDTYNPLSLFGYDTAEEAEEKGDTKTAEDMRAHERLREEARKRAADARDRAGKDPRNKDEIARDLYNKYISYSRLSAGQREAPGAYDAIENNIITYLGKLLLQAQQEWINITTKNIYSNDYMISQLTPIIRRSVLY